MLQGGMRRVGGHHDSPATTPLPGGGMGSGGRPGRRRVLKGISLAVPALFFTLIVLLYCFSGRNASVEVSHGAGGPELKELVGVDDVVAQLFSDAERRKLQGWTKSPTVVSVRPTPTPTRPSEFSTTTTSTTTTTTTSTTTTSTTTSAPTSTVVVPPAPATTSPEPIPSTPEPTTEASPATEERDESKNATDSHPAATANSTIAAQSAKDASATLSDESDDLHPLYEEDAEEEQKNQTLTDLDPNDDTQTETLTVATPNLPLTAQESATDRRTTRPHMYSVKRRSHVELGEYEPEEPDRLPGLQPSRRTFTPDELLHTFGDTDFIYSFVNGSELHHEYRKAVRHACLSTVLQHANAFYLNGSSTALHDGFAGLNCLPSFFQGENTSLVTAGDLVATVKGDARHGADNRDRETDELRHSIRSVEQHVGWHRGRVVVVSPGHHPTWVDGAKNFLAGVCGDATVQALRSRGTHLRLTTVHQDAIMPYGMRFTANSHVIEQHIWRVRNTTAVHVYMNDDYFVNRDVAITDLFNEYGGTIVRAGGGFLRDGAFPQNGGSWKAGVLHTQQFNIQELDVRHEDELPADLISVWQTLGRLNASAAADGQLVSMPAPPLDEAVDVAHQYSPAQLPRTPLSPRRPRRYATHAPFVYCTNMLRFLETRYEREFAAAALRHRSRRSADLFIPFLYNAFIMARPWQASPQFLPYLLQLHRSRELEGTGTVTPAVNISLDNFDGCAPATLLAGADGSECLFAKFMNNLTRNEEVVARVKRTNPLYFNINAGFNSDAAADQLRQFLHEKFPTPVYLENGESLNATAAADVALQSLFAQLMALPVVGLVSYEEGVCPLVRSLPLAFAGHHRGRVHVAVHRHGDGESDESLRDTRARLEHRVVSAIPTPLCAYGARTTVGASARGESVSDAAERVLVDGDGAGVELPATCGGGLAGLRVRGFVVDARTPGAPVASAAALRDALAMPGQTLALEDFRAVRVGPEDGDVVLVLAREDAAAKAVHWIGGASENDLLVTYPLPVEAYEDMSAPLRWAIP